MALNNTKHFWSPNWSMDVSQSLQYELQTVTEFGISVPLRSCYYCCRLLFFSAAHCFVFRISFPFEFPWCVGVVCTECFESKRRSNLNVNLSECVRCVENPFGLLQISFPHPRRRFYCRNHNFENDSHNHRLSILLRFTFVTIPVAFIWHTNTYTLFSVDHELNTCVWIW